jgi:hypothetical protein
LSSKSAAFLQKLFKLGKTVSPLENTLLDKSSFLALASEASLRCGAQTAMNKTDKYKYFKTMKSSYK